MADYWKSLPKKYCDFCKCWITDNKASRDFHERGYRHQANVRRKVKDIQKNSSVQEKERQKYYNEMVKIETAALNSFKGDLARSPSLASEISSNKSIASQFKSNNSTSSSSIVATNRFGEDFGDYNESEKLANGKKRALETIAKSFEKKSKWLEAKTSDGISYYWNKETLETRSDAPKSGYLSISEQEQFKNSSDSAQSIPGESINKVFRVDPYGGWKNVEKYDTKQMIDLQLPDQNISQIVLELEQAKAAEQESIENKEKMKKDNFKEKTVESLDRPLFNSSKKNENISFKKRTNIKRNIRNKSDE